MSEKMIAIRLSKEESAKLDPAKRGVGVLKPVEQEVEGQYHYWRQVVCPNCDAIIWIWYDTNLYHSYTCGNCGGGFRV
ncbi:MAG TPA: hypothetical protein PKO15_15750 [Fibrobacteria bacterium]|nr:hypothetical protein [Fibrobacteria bacterium]